MNLTTEQICVQACHASLEISRQTIDKHTEHPSIIVCGIKNEEKLLSVCDYFKNNNIPFIEFREPDLLNQLTSLATTVLYGDQRRLMKKFQLLKFKGEVK